MNVCTGNKQPTEPLQVSGQQFQAQGGVEAVSVGAVVGRAPPARRPRAAAYTRPLADDARTRHH